MSENSTAKRRHRCAVVAGIGIGIAALMVSIVQPQQPRLLWNASASAPIGLYCVDQGTQAGLSDMVVARLPEPFRQLAADRHYLPKNVPLLKRVAAVAGDGICSDGARLLLNDRQIAERRFADREGRAMPGWHGCETLGSGQFLLLSDHPDSFDGRYFGAVGAASIVGKAHPLWLP